MSVKIVMSGSTGFVGRYLTNAFLDEGWEVAPLNRKSFILKDNEFADVFKGCDVVVNLAGAPIAAKWTEEYKKELYSSRIDTTHRIVNALKNMTDRPSLFISTSAVGIYSSEGEHTEETYTYSSDFLGKLALDWEREALGAVELGIRTIIFRFGIVLGRGGGALEKMLLPFKLGLGGSIGNGEQFFSWIHIEDLKRAYIKVINDKSFSGIYNMTSPEPSTNAELTRELGEVLGRPAFLSVPSFLIRIKYGEGSQVLLGGQHVLPHRLLDDGFEFRYPVLKEALKDIIYKGDKT